MKKYWYKFFMFYCPICGEGETVRERQYTPKPKDDAARYQTIERYDWCNE